MKSATTTATSGSPFDASAGAIADLRGGISERVNDQRGIGRDVLVPVLAATLGFLVVALQRFSLPIPGYPVPVVAVLVAPFLIAALLGRIVAVRRLGTVLYVLLIAVAAASFLINSDSTIPVSITSLLFLATIYLAVVVLPHQEASASSADIGRNFFSGATSAIVLGAALALVQAISQWLHRGYPDPIAALTQDLQLQGYHSYYTTQWIPNNLGLPVKPNGMIFLEPSFLSLYAAVALVIVIQRLLRGGRKLILLPVAALLFVTISLSMSTSGLPCLMLGLLFMLREIVRRVYLVLVMFGLLIAGFLSGLLDGVIAKALEGFGSNTSTGLRITEPYKHLTDYWLDKPIIGNGPGTVTHMVEQSGLLQLQTPPTVRMLAEYGIIGFLIWAAIICLVLVTSRAPWSIRVAVLAAYLIPTDGLLNPVMVASLLVGLALWSNATSADREPALQERDVSTSGSGRHRA